MSAPIHVPLLAGATPAATLALHVLELQHTAMLTSAETAKLIAADNSARVHYEGLLQKKGNGIFDHYQDRYFVLDEGVLRWWVKEADHTDLGTVRGSVPVSDILGVVDVASRSGHCNFRLDCRLRKYNIRGYNQEDKQAWMEVLERVSGPHDGVTSPNHSSDLGAAFETNVFISQIPSSQISVIGSTSDQLYVGRADGMLMVYSATQPSIVVSEHQMPSKAAVSQVLAVGAVLLVLCDGVVYQLQLDSLQPVGDPAGLISNITLLIPHASDRKVHTHRTNCARLTVTAA